MIGLQVRPDRDAVADLLREERDRALAAAARRAAEMAPSVLIDTDSLPGQPAQAVTESGSGALMLVVGSRGIGAFAAMVLGSVSRYATAHASCPVVVVRDETAAVRRQISVGIGDLDSYADSLTFAFEEASLRTASLLVMHAWHTPQTGISRAGSPSPVPGSYASRNHVGPGRRVRAELLGICRNHGMRLVGPASFGVASTSVSLDATFAAGHPRPGTAGLALQSGGVGIVLLEHLSRLGVGISSFVSLGDTVDVSGNDMLLWRESDAVTKLAVLYLDSFGNPRKFARTARNLGRTMPVLTVNAGRSAAGQRLAAARAAANQTAAPAGAACLPPRNSPGRPCSGRRA